MHALQRTHHSLRTGRIAHLATARSNGRARAAAKWLEGAPSSPSASARNTEHGLFINSHFDSGNCEVEDFSDPSNIRLRIHQDPYCETDGVAHAQWFNFRITGCRDVPLVINITNAGQASFPEAWPGYQACASYDLEHWFRAATTYDPASGVLSISHTPARDAVQFAFFAPYTLDRHAQLIARMQAREGVRLEMIGETADAHDLDLLRIGDPGPDKRKVWVIARQHPGESMAEWLAEGVLEKLTDPHDAVARALLRDAVVYVMPCVCPDGVWRGHLRTNAAGVNLNRVWADPDPDSAPEVYHLLRKMDEVGVDVLVDVHGDEEIPANFIAGAEGIPGWTDRLRGLTNSFASAFERHSPDFQTKLGYPPDEANGANMGVCSSAIAQRFDCLAVTLEQPFKDTADLPHPQGWTPERAKRLGASMMAAILEVLPQLR